jgi:hypothetical protein
MLCWMLDPLEERPMCKPERRLAGDRNVAVFVIRVI